MKHIIGDSIIPVLTQRIYFEDAHENNNKKFILQLLHNIFEHVYNPGN